MRFAGGKFQIEFCHFLFFFFAFLKWKTKEKSETYGYYFSRSLLYFFKINTHFLVVDLSQISSRHCIRKSSNDSCK